MAGKKIIISLTIFLTMLSPAIQAQIISLTGKVVDTKGNPVVSASIRIINSDQGTSSDSLGIFSLRIKQGNSVLVSAIGYSDTVFSAVNRVGLLIVLQPNAKALQEVVVSGTNQTTEISSPEEVPREQIIASTFESYLREAEFSNGIYVISKLGTGGISRIILTGFGGLNTLNSGVTLPVVEHKEDTKGSRYLLNRFSRGLIVDQNNKFITDSNNLLNYDKIDDKLMIAQDGKNYLEVDKEKVIAFAFKTQDSSYVFLNVPALSKTNYFLLIANGPKYSVYKSIKTKFVKSTYVSNGLVETGNNYDEYVDNQTYYWIDQKNNKAGILELKKKSIREVFESEKEKTDQFFTNHKLDNLDDGFLRNFINYLNE
jgi:CarboxypepD_reg-like domain